MRFSSNQMFSQVSESMLKQEAEFSRLVEQMSTGRRILSAGDDPLAASQSVNVAGALSQANAFKNNRASADQALNAQEGALASATTTMQSVLERLVNAGNGTLSDTDRKSLATDLKGMRDTLIGLANSTDGNGRYIFSGYDSETPAYDQNGSYLVTADRNRAPTVQVSQSRVIAAGVVGSDVFSRANPGSNSYVVGAADTNAGTARVGPLVNDTTVAAVSRTVTFGGFPGALTYSFVNNAGAAITRPYVEGEALDLDDGMSLPLSGTPAAGDSFQVMHIQDDGVVDMFGSLDKLIAGLETATVDDPQAAAAWANIKAEHTKVLQNGYDNILTIRSNLGSKMQEIDALNGVGTSDTLAYSKQLSGLEDVNIVTAMSEATQRQTALQAAGMAFKMIQGLNLFQQ